MFQSEASDPPIYIIFFLPRKIANLFPIKSSIFIEYFPNHIKETILYKSKEFDGFEMY